MTEFNLISTNPLVKKIADGQAKQEMLDLLLTKQLPFTEEEYLESLVYLLKQKNLKSQAMEQLKKISDSSKLNYIDKNNNNHRVAYFIVLEALNWGKNQIVARAIHNQSLPTEFLIKIAEKGDNSILEMLLDNQIKLIAYPEIMKAMEKNPSINNFIKGRINELRAYYLQEEKADEIPLEEVIDDVKEIIAQEHKDLQKKEQAHSEEIDDEDLQSLEEIEVKDRALTTLQEINNMCISDRIKLALTGAKTHRMILIKDTNKMVALAVLESPKISIDEILMLAQNKSLAVDIITRLSNNREWVKNYSVMLALLQNPKTPIKSALAFVNRLRLRDLKILGANKNTNPVIREFAAKLYSQRVRTARS